MNRANVVSLASGLGLLALTACDFAIGSSPGSLTGGPIASGGGAPTGLQTQQACRERVDETFDKQNRPAIYAANSSANTPYSANFNSGVTTRGLSGQFAYEQSVAACEQSGGGIDRTDTLPPPAKGR
jgi:hypothetical protein